MPARRQREKCRDCFGRGKTNQFTGRAAPDGSPELALRPCIACEGRGWHLKALSDARRLRALEKDVRRLRQRVRDLEARFDDEPRPLEQHGTGTWWVGEAGPPGSADYFPPAEPEKPPKSGHQRQLP